MKFKNDELIILHHALENYVELINETIDEHSKNYDGNIVNFQVEFENLEELLNKSSILLNNINKELIKNSIKE